MTAGYIANLIQGISQQPSNIRFPNQADRCVNWMPTIQQQLGRRNPLEILFKLSGATVDSNSYVNWYRRDASEMYSIIMNGTGIQVYSAVDGTAKTVTMSQPGGDTYHQAASPKNDFYLYTYKDTTFIVNRSILAAMDSGSVSSSRTPEGLIKVKDAVNGYTYDVKIKVGAGSAVSIGTVTAGSSDTVNTIASSLKTAIDALAVSGLTTTVRGNVVWLTHASSAITIEVTDNRSGTAIMSFTSTVQKSSDLPAYAPDGYLVKVVGNTGTGNSQDQNTVDDIVYRFKVDGNSTFASGVWQESIAGGLKYKLDAKTMPHKLVRNPDGTFTYSQITWDDRLVGDETTNPEPPFIGRAIWSCYLTGNRFGIDAGDTSILSKVDEVNYFNFWKTTVLTALDTDPVWMPVPSSQVNKVYHSLQWNGELMHFGENLDASVSWNSTLAPNKININTPTRFGIHPYTPPVLSGGSLLFPKNRGDYSILYEYKLDPVTTLKDADNLTDYCGAYIPKNVVQTAGTEKDFLAVLADADRSKIYCYNYSKKNSRLVQQAFHHWEFDSDITIYSIFADNGILYVLCGFAGSVFIANVSISVGSRDTNYPGKCYMDIRISETFSGFSASYNAGTDKTTFTLPFSYGANSKTIELRDTFTNSYGQFPVGKVLQVDSETSTTIVVVGDWATAKVYVGLSYESYYDPCRFHAMTPNADRSGMVVDLWKKITVRKIALAYTDTGYYEVEIRDRNTDEIVGQPIKMPIRLDNSRTAFDTYKLYSDFQVMTIGKSMDQFYLRIKNGTTKPSFFTALAWIGEYLDAAK